MHTIGAFAVICDEQDRVLLCHRTDQDLWNLPGGSVGPRESPWQAVIREVREETGLWVTIDRLLGVYADRSRDDLVFNFLCTRRSGELRLNPEADAFGWYAGDALPANTLPRHVERIGDALQKGGSLILKDQQ